jgi:hypothetical protein
LHAGFLKTTVDPDPASVDGLMKTDAGFLKTTVDPDPASVDGLMKTDSSLKYKLYVD